MGIGMAMAQEYVKWTGLFLLYALVCVLIGGLLLRKGRFRVASLVFSAILLPPLYLAVTQYFLHDATARSALAEAEFRYRCAQKPRIDIRFVSDATDDRLFVEYPASGQAGAEWERIAIRAARFEGSPFSIVTDIENLESPRSTVKFILHVGSRVWLEVNGREAAQFYTWTRNGRVCASTESSLRAMLDAAVASPR